MTDLSASAEPIVSARGLRKSFGRREILHGLDFDIPAGRIYGLIGHNGAGKTTALNALLGLTNCEGTIRVLGEDPFAQRAKLMENVAFISDVASLPRFLRSPARRMPKSPRPRRSSSISRPARLLPGRARRRGHRPIPSRCSPASSIASTSMSPGCPSASSPMPSSCCLCRWRPRWMALWTKCSRPRGYLWARPMCRSMACAAQGPFWSAEPSFRRVDEAFLNRIDTPN